MLFLKMVLPIKIDFKPVCGRPTMALAWHYHSSPHIGMLVDGIMPCSISNSRPFVKWHAEPNPTPTLVSESIQTPSRFMPYNQLWLCEYTITVVLERIKFPSTALELSH